MSEENPFFHRGAIRHHDDFIGRESEIAQILGLLRNGQSVSLIGPRRIGKSSLLLQLGNPFIRRQYNLDPGQAINILIDCQELADSPPEEVYEAILNSLIQASKEAGSPMDIDHDPRTYRALDRALFEFIQRQVGVVVMLDEFELLAANRQLSPYFFARMRGLTTKYGLAFLTASQRPLFAITAEEEILSSPFFNIFVTLPLGLFNETEARTLLSDRLARTNIEFSDKLVNHLLNLVGYHPFFLHIAGYHAYQALAKQNDKWPNSLSVNIEPSVLDGPIEIEAESHLAYVWQNLTPEEKHVLAIADGPTETIRQLEQQCLLYRAGTEYRYSSEILQRFVRRQAVPGLVQAGPFVIDENRHQVWGQGRLLNLTASQFNILVRLCQEPGQVVRAEDLEMSVWGDVLVDDPDRLKTLIKRLRRAVDPFDNWIVSERGIGYALREPENA